MIFQFIRKHFNTSIFCSLVTYRVILKLFILQLSKFIITIVGDQLVTAGGRIEYVRLFSWVAIFVLLTFGSNGILPRALGKLPASGSIWHTNVSGTKLDAT
jgi:hypothetical protein